MTRVVIAGYWWARGDLPEVCAARLLRVVEATQRLGPSFGQLFRSRDHPRQPLLHMPTEPSALAAVIRSGVMRTDTNKLVVEGGGYSEAWDDNTRRFDQASVSLYCGATSPWAVANNVIVRVPPEIDAGTTPAAAIEHVLRTIIASFDPRFAIVDVGDSTTHRDPRHRHLPQVSWMLYLRGERPKVVAEIAATEFARGTIFRSTSDWFSPENPTHIAAARNLELALMKSGALERAMRRTPEPPLGETA
jgi:Immunity protein 52